LTQDRLFSSRRCSFLFSSVQGHNTPKEKKVQFSKNRGKNQSGHGGKIALLRQKQIEKPRLITQSDAQMSSPTMPSARLSSS
jgi:hypothetical protein